MAENPRFLRYFTKAAAVIQKLSQGTADEKTLYAFLGTVFTCATPATIGKQVPAEDFSLFAAHTKGVLSEVATTSHGVLEEQYVLLLCACAVSSRTWNMNQSLLMKNGEESIFSVVAKLCASRRELVDTAMATEVVRLVSSFLDGRVKEVEMTLDELYDILHHFDSCGFLTQLFHAMIVVSNEEDGYGSTCLNILAILESDIRIVCKRLHPGTKTGGALKAICEETLDRARKDNAVMAALRRIQRTAEQASCDPEVKKYPVGCCHCSNKALFNCARCHATSCK